MATMEQFSLRWNNFYSNLTTGFHDLMQANDMVDVTLAVEGQFLQAHKIVLSICSPLFKQLFKLNPCRHPVIILRDVAYGNLKDILEFMYLGEVNVLRDNLSAFLRTAESLQVKGLTGDESSETSSTKDDKSDLLSDNNLEQDVQQFGQLIESSDAQMTQYSSPPSPLETPPVPTIKRPQKNSNGSTKRFKTDVNKLREEDVDGSASFLTLPTGNVKNETEELSPSKDVTEQLLDSSGQELISQDQGKTEGQSNNKHPYKCEKCSKQFSRRDHLRTHEKNIHGEDAGPFACIICSQLYKNSESLRKHIAKFHCHKLNEVLCKIQSDP